MNETLPQEKFWNKLYLFSKDIFNGLDSGTKTEVVRESFISSLVNDITDIAILQEVIDRSWKKEKKIDVLFYKI